IVIEQRRHTSTSITITSTSTITRGTESSCNADELMRSYAMPEQKRIAVAAAYLALCVIWSSTWLVIRVGLQDLPPISFVAIRFVIAVAVLLAISIGRVRLLPAHRSDLILLAYTGVLMFSVNYALLFWGELYVSSGLSAVLQATI